MKASIATFGLTCFLVGTVAEAQTSQFGRFNKPSNSAASTADPAKTDPKVLPASAPLPEPADPDTLPPASIVLPENPIEPFLLTKDNGPFMVTAKSFKGPDAERYALALVLELRNDYGLPAYILRLKDFPMKSMIRNVPPTADEFIRKPNLTNPERSRSYDEATVLVGNEKTLNDSVKLLDRVKKIKPKCLEQMPAIYKWRSGSGLKTATRTTNPYVPTQMLFPGPRQDKMVIQMNSGPHTVYKCPGRYTLQIADISGRSITNPNMNDPRIDSSSELKKSPLMTAMDDAERLANTINKDPEVSRMGYQTYVYHDRTSSKVMIGSFNRPDDPAAAKLRETIVRNLLAIKNKDRAAGYMLAPAYNLTDLEDPGKPIKPQK